MFILPFVFFAVSASLAFAQTPTVVFEQTPLFLNASIMPGDAESRTVSVTNPGPETEDVYVSVQNTYSTGLAEVMNIAVTSPGMQHFAGVFESFFTATPIALGTLPPNTTKVYTFSASLAADTGNAYQEKQLGFDLIIGFVGGGTVIDTPGGGNGGSGRGGSVILNIFNEEVDGVQGDAATLSWNTNLNASTYLVCGVVTDVPFVLTATPPLFGYQFVLPETVSVTKVHTAVLNDLDIGTYECRPAGRIDDSKPFTVGEALRFTIGPEGLVAGAVTSAPLPNARPFTPTGSVLGASGKGMFGAPTYDEWKAELEAEKKAAAEAALLAASSTASGGAEQGGAGKSNDSKEGEGSTSDTSSWYWLLGLLAGALGVWYWRVSSRS